jgi:hypothetical protein
MFSVRALKLFVADSFLRFSAADLRSWLLLGSCPADVTVLTLFTTPHLPVHQPFYPFQLQ